MDPKVLNKQFRLTPEEARRLTRIAFELGATSYEAFHIVLSDALETWHNGLKAANNGTKRS